MYSTNKPLKIVADAMLSLDSLSDSLPVEVTSLPGREINRQCLRQADALMVRSITTVDGGLISGTPMQFVGTATIGTDHVDTVALARQDIRFASAPGCNANAVVDYVMSALLAHFGSDSLPSITVGIAGFGNVGSRLVRCLQYFGINCQVYDPYVAVPAEWRADSLHALLSCEALSLHVPLSLEGPNATRHLIGEQAFEQLNDNTLLLNTSRGAVVDNRAMKRWLGQNSGHSAVLDVWEKEPEIDIELMSLLRGATGHIAGYSRAGKQRGVVAIVQAMVRHFQMTGDLSTMENALGSRALVAGSLSDFENLADYANVLNTVCDLPSETRQFREQLAPQTADNVATAFDSYRRNYALRREIDYLK